ncbi:MAG: hypothetical protein ACJA0U_001645 [Salibacteraceae bacterium]
MKTLTKTLAALALASAVSFQSSAQSPGSGNAFDFNSNYISIPHDASINPDYITLEAWIKADSWATNVWENVIISKDGWQTGDEGYVLRAGANGTLSFNFSLGAAWTELNSAPGAMVIGQWYHVAGTFDGTTMKIYINGVEVGAQAASGIVNTGTYDLTIGRAAYTIGGTRYFDGMIDEVRVWSEGLPQSSILDYMCQKVTASHPQYASLGGYWNFDAAGIAADSSPNGNDGTVFGAAQLASGAAIGDESIYSFVGPVDMTLPYGAIDSVQVVSLTATQPIHLYRVDMIPNSTTTPSSIVQVDDSHYYGVFSGGTSSYDMGYYYDGNALATGNEQYLNLAGRTNGTELIWFSQGATVNMPASKLEKTLSSRVEVMLAAICPSVNLNVSGAQTVCTGDTISLFDQSVNSNYQWNDANGVIVGATTNALDVWTAGVYYLVANDGICTDTSNTVTFTVSPYPTADFGTLSTTYCVTDVDDNFAGGTPAGGTYSGTGVVGGTAFSPPMAGAGTFMLYYTYANAGGCSDMDSLEVTVNAQPSQPIITWNLLLDTAQELCTDGCGAGSTLEWFLDGTSIQNGTDLCHGVMSNGLYTVACTYNGCSSDTSVSYLIDDLGVASLTGVDLISISPNPTTDFISISLGSDENTQFNVTLIDASSRVLVNKSHIGNSIELDLTDYGTGMYIVTIETANGAVAKKVLKN